jgi:MFS family permease
MLGDKLFYIALLTYASSLENPVLAISIVSISVYIPNFTTFIMGNVANRIQKKAEALIFSMVFRCVLYFVISILMGFTSAFWIVIVVSVISTLSAIAGTFELTAQTPFIQQIVPEDELEEAMGVDNSIQGTISFFANFVSAILVMILSFQLFSVVNATIFACAGIIVASMLAKLRPIQKEKIVPDNNQSFKRDLVNNFKDVIKSNIFSAVLALLLLNAALAAYVAILPILLNTKPSLVIGNFGFSIALYEGVIGITAVLGGLVMPIILKKVPMTIVLIICAIFASLLGVVLIVGNSATIIAMIIPTTLSVAACSAKFGKLILESTTPEKLAGFNGVVMTFSSGGQPIIVGVMLLAANVFANNIAVGIIIVISIISIVASLFYAFKIKQKKVTLDSDRTKLLCPS